MARKVAINLGQRMANNNTGRLRGRGEGRNNLNSSVASQHDKTKTKNSQSQSQSQTGVSPEKNKANSNKRGHEEPSTSKDSKGLIQTDEPELKRQKTEKLKEPVLIHLTIESSDDIEHAMGFKTFKSTKNTQVPNNRAFSANVMRHSEYRQYMNRSGGFNRPLSPTRGDRKKKAKETASD